MQALNGTASITTTISPVLDTDDTHAITDKQWFEDNILSLLSSAVQHSSQTPDQPVHLEVTLKSRCELRNPFNRKSTSENTLYMHVSVKDHGPGISDELRPLVFQPSPQASRSEGGAGLGLYSMAQRVEALGGYYGVHALNLTDSSSGSVLWFAVPYEAHVLPPSEWQTTPDPTPRTEDTVVGEYVDTNENIDLDATSDLSARLSLDSRTWGSACSDDTDEKQPAGSVNLHCNSGLTSPSHTPPDSPSRRSSPSPPHERSPESPSRMHLAPSPVRSRAAPQLKLHLNILLVDDSMLVLKLTSNLLRQRGHTVTVATNGLEAYELYHRSLLEGCTSSNPPSFNTSTKATTDGSDETCSSQEHSGSGSGSDSNNNSNNNTNTTNSNTNSSNKHTFDVIITDIQMPIMCGLQSTRLIRLKESEIHTQREIVIIGFSANSESTTKIDAYNAGVDAFLPKPFNITTFEDIYMTIAAKR